MVDRLRALHRVVLFVAALACRCATATNTRSERGTAFFERPGTLVAALLLSSCATAFTGTRESISVESTPAGAEARLSCAGIEVASGVTPSTLSLQRKTGTCTLTISKAGFVDETRQLEQGLNPAYWANFITLPVIEAGIAGGTFVGGIYVLAGAGLAAVGGSGWVIDYRTGAMHSHRPRAVRVTLRPKG